MRAAGAEWGDWQTGRDLCRCFGAVWQVCVGTWYETLLWWKFKKALYGPPQALLLVVETGRVAFSRTHWLAQLLGALVRAIFARDDSDIFVARQWKRWALVAPALGDEDSFDGNMVPRRFFVVRGVPDRPEEWDEYYVLASGDSADCWVCFSTEPTRRWTGFYDVLVNVGDFRMVGGVYSQRTALGVGSPAVSADAVNWLCVPGRGERWPPAEIALGHPQVLAAVARRFLHSAVSGGPGASSLTMQCRRPLERSFGVSRRRFSQGSSVRSACSVVGVSCAFL